MKIKIEEMKKQKRKQNQNRNKKQKVRGLAIEKILEILQGGAETSAFIIDLFFSGPGVYKKAREAMMGRGKTYFEKDWAYEYKERQKFYSLFNYLKKQGFIKKEKKKPGSFWEITKWGLEKLKLLKEKKNFSVKKYKREKDNKLKVIIFDIPEKEREKREWLRAALSFLGFSMLQLSVWVGHSKLPIDFVTDLKERNLIRHVHIFEVNKRGTIKE